MKNLILAFLIVAITSCQTVKIKNNTYNVSTVNVELGSIGQSKSTIKFQNDFEFKTIAKLENKIRLSIEVIPFTKKLNKVYQQKAKFNQAQSELTYVDSLPIKPELVVIRFLDIAGFIGALNADYNKEAFKLIRDTKNTKIVSSIAITMTKEDIAKIRQADAYYLTNNQDKKYSILLFKQGKKTETLDLYSGTVLSYRVSKFCWAPNERGNWYIADMAEGSSSCKGNTKSNIQEKEKIKNLYKM
jgi:hypothetical protein